MMFSDYMLNDLEIKKLNTKNIERRCKKNKTFLKSLFQNFLIFLLYLKLFRAWFFLMYITIFIIQHCFICSPSDSSVLEDARIDQSTIATSALAVRCSTWLDLIHNVWLRFRRAEDKIRPSCG
jgi:hypothetical protein